MPAYLEYTSGDGYAVLEFDGAEEEGYEFSAEATEHAVERGAPVVDHTRRNADTISVKGWITNRPLFLPRGATGGATASWGTRDITVGGRTFRATTFAPTEGYDRVAVAHELLESLVGNGLCRWTGSLGTTTEDLIVTRYRVDRTAETAGALAVQLDLRKLRFATTDRQAVAPRQRRAIPREERGAQPARLESTARAAGREVVNAVRDALRGRAAGGDE